jgi:hypothetical protein
VKRIRARAPQWHDDAPHVPAPECLVDPWWAGRRGGDYLMPAFCQGAQQVAAKVHQRFGETSNDEQFSGPHHGSVFAPTEASLGTAGKHAAGVDRRANFGGDGLLDHTPSA